jgi:hypothetical protein
MRPPPGITRSRDVSSGTSRIVIPGGAYSATKSALNMIVPRGTGRTGRRRDQRVGGLPGRHHDRPFDVLRAGAPTQPGRGGGHTAESVAELILDVVRDGSAEAFAAYP